MAALRRSALIRVACFIFGLFVLFNFFYGFFGFIDSLKDRGFSSLSWKHYPSKETLENLSLTEKQCRATFPGLMKEVDDAVARGPFDLKKEPDDYTGMVQLRIKDGKASANFCLQQPFVRIADFSNFRCTS